jgi:DNA-binding response OmpR family regulator
MAATMRTVLIVDDQPQVRELLQVTLEASSNPLRILTAANGDQALALAQAELPELMILDIQMPKGQLDGLDVCRLLKADKATRPIFIILLTVKGQRWDRQVGQAAGADDYMVKPFSPLELLNKVEAALGEGTVA